MQTNRLSTLNTKGEHRVGYWVNLMVVIALLIGGCAVPAAPEEASSSAAIAPEQRRDTSIQVAPTTTPTANLATATPLPTSTARPSPTPRRITIRSNGSSSRITVRQVTSTPTSTPSPVPTVGANAQSVAENAAPLIFTGLNIAQKCGRGDIVAEDGHALRSTPHTLGDNSNFLELLPKGAQVDIIDCRLWTDKEGSSWLAVRTAKGKLGWMLVQPDKFYVTLFPIALTVPRSLTGIPAGTTVAYTPPSDCEEGPVSNEAVATSIGIDLIPVIGDIKGLGEAATGCDLVTGESLGDWRWFGLLGIIGLSELALARHGDDAVRGMRVVDDVNGGFRYGDDILEAIGKQADLARDASKLNEVGDTAAAVARAIDTPIGDLDEAARMLAKIQPCSFSADTLVSTMDGLAPIETIASGDFVLAYDEERDVIGYYPVIARSVHTDDVITILVFKSEQVVTTPNHPFYTRGHWVPAGQLVPGAVLSGASNTSGTIIQAYSVREHRTMYNLTIAVAHTFFIGRGQWLVHNECQRIRKALSNLGANKIHHILQEKHAWHLVTDSPDDWQSVSRIIADVLENGDEVRYGRNALARDMKVGDQTVRVTYMKLDDESIRISDAWVVTK